LTSVAACLALVVTAGLFAEVPAGADAAPKTLQMPTTGWGHPASGQWLDGMGTWLYVLPQAATGPGQLSRDGYQYQMTFVFDHLRIGSIGVGHGPNGPVAQLEIKNLFTGAPASAEIAYNWSPGHFYFAYTQRLANGDIAGWILDWDKGAWAYIGTVHPLVDWGKMVSVGTTSVKWAAGRTAPAACSGYPRTDAYFYPVLGYIGSSFEIGAFGGHEVEAGDCQVPVPDILDTGWVHYRLGADPA
jgi:hypothetical protein